MKRKYTIILTLYLFLVIPAYFLQKSFYSATRPNNLNYAAIGAQISKRIIQEIFSDMDETNEIFSGIFSNSITWVNQDVLNIFIRSKCAADDYVVSGIGVSKRFISI